MKNLNKPPPNCANEEPCYDVSIRSSTAGVEGSMGSEPDSPQTPQTPHSPLSPERIAPASKSLVQWDSSHSHMLSRKAILEGWDTFFWFGESLVNFGNLATGMNTKRFDLTTAEVFKWLGLITHNNLDARVEIVPCEVEDIGILSYLPVNDKPWEMEERGKPGNFRLVNPDPYGYYGGLSVAGAKTIEQWEEKLGSYITASHVAPGSMKHP